MKNIVCWGKANECHNLSLPPRFKRNVGSSGFVTWRKLVDIYRSFDDSLSVLSSRVKRSKTRPEH